MGVDGEVHGTDFSLPPLDAPVLVAEDDDIQALLLLTFLERFGIPAQRVRNGLQAVEALRSRTYSLVLMDQMMPGMDGVEATSAIREWERCTGTPRTPIVAVTASGMTNQRERFFAAGIDALLLKPFSVREFHGVLQHHVRPKNKA